MGGHGFDLTFPREVLENLKPTLEELGFTIGKAETTDPITYSRKIKVTVLKRGAEIIYLICLDQEMVNLESSMEDDLYAMAYLEHCLPKEGTLVLTSERLNSLSSEIDRLLDIWKGHRVNVQFIPWRLIDSLPPSDVEGRAHELARILKVKMPPSPTNESPAKALHETLTPNDVEEIAKIMEPLASTHPGGAEQWFRNLIGQTKLPSDWREQVLGGWQPGVTPKAFARILVQWAIPRGLFTPEGETGEVAVLAEIIAVLMENCGNNEKKQLLEIAERSRLLDELTPRRLKAN